MEHLYDLYRQGLIMISGKSLLNRIARQQQRQTGHYIRGLADPRIGRPPSTRGGSVNYRTRTFSLVRVSDPSSHGRFTRGSNRIPLLQSNPRRQTTTTIMARRMASNDTAAPAAEPTSEETAQQLSQLLEQPLALESFITKELTANQRHAIQRLVLSPEVLDVNVPEPSHHSLRLVATNTAIPFVGFGIMDNMM